MAIRFDPGAQPERPRLLGSILGVLGLALVALALLVAPVSGEAIFAREGTGGAACPVQAVALSAHGGVETGVCASLDAERLCADVYTGTLRAVYTIAHPNGIHGLQNYELANYRVRVLNPGSSPLRVEVFSQLTLATQARYPVNAGALSASVRAYLNPTPGFIQSDRAEIVALAQTLAQGRDRQADVVEAVVAWMRAHVHYSEASASQDALSVWQRRTANSRGFATLAIALLRAAGIPAREVTGAVTATPVLGWAWTSVSAGEWRSWLEAYYPDVGWIGSDPRLSANWLDPAHIAIGFEECNNYRTLITCTAYTDLAVHTTLVGTPYTPTDNLPSRLIYPETASLPRTAFRTLPRQASLWVGSQHPTTSFELAIDDLGCEAQSWELVSNVDWLQPLADQGVSSGRLVVAVDATGLSSGIHYGTLTLSRVPAPGEGSLSSQQVSVTLRVVDELHRALLPLVARQSP